VAETSWPTATTRIVTDDQYEVLGRAFAGDGVMQGPAATAVVYADSSGRQVKVRASKQAYLRGRGWDSGLTETIVSIAANASGSTRYDVVVLRFTRATFTVAVAVVQGTPGAGTPTVTQDAGTTGVWEMPLARVTVASGATTIAAGDIWDLAPMLVPGGGVTHRSLSSLALCVVAPVEGMIADIANSDYLVRYNDTVWVPWSGAIIARGNRVSSSTATTTEVGVLRLPVGTLAAGVTYKICSSSMLIACTAGATVGAYLRYTTDGSSPTTGSTAMIQAQVDIAVSYQSLSLAVLYTPASAVNLTLLLTCARVSGSGNASIIGASATPIDLWVEVSAKDVGDTGVDI
jgi:hypothetical protein